jgi:flagellar protein FliS
MGTPLAKAYLLTKVLSAANHQVVVYLYEALLAHLHRAQQALAEGQDGAAARSIDRATSILIELSGGLNYTTGGHLALKLDAIYSHLIESLTLAAIQADAEVLRNCEGIILVLHGAWVQAASAIDEPAAAEEEDRAWPLPLAAS